MYYCICWYFKDLTMYSRYNTGYMRHDNTHDDTELKVGCISSAGPRVTGLPPRACVSESQSEEVPNKNPRTQAPGNSHGVFCCLASRGGRLQATSRQQEHSARAAAAVN